MLWKKNIPSTGNLDQSSCQAFLHILIGIVKYVGYATQKPFLSTIYYSLHEIKLTKVKVFHSSA